MSDPMINSYQLQRLKAAALIDVQWPSDVLPISSDVRELIVSFMIWFAAEVSSNQMKEFLLGLKNNG